MWLRFCISGTLPAELQTSSRGESTENDSAPTTVIVQSAKFSGRYVCGRLWEKATTNSRKELVPSVKSQLSPGGGGARLPNYTLVHLRWIYHA
jgi:hypothetical protein